MLKIDQHQVFDQISGSKIRNSKTKGQNVLNLTLMGNDFISRSIRYDFQYISSKSNFKELIVNGGCIKCSVVTERSYMKSRNRILRSS